MTSQTLKTFVNGSYRKGRVKSTVDLTRPVHGTSKTVDLTNCKLLTGNFWIEIPSFGRPKCRVFGSKHTNQSDLLNLSWNLSIFTVAITVNHRDCFWHRLTKNWHKHIILLDLQWHQWSRRFVVLQTITPSFCSNELPGRGHHLSIQKAMVARSYCALCALVESNKRFRAVLFKEKKSDRLWTIDPLIFAMCLPATLLIADFLIHKLDQPKVFALLALYWWGSER